MCLAFLKPNITLATKTLEIGDICLPVPEMNNEVVEWSAIIWTSGSNNLKAIASGKSLMKNAKDVWTFEPYCRALNEPGECYFSKM